MTASPSTVPATPHRSTGPSATTRRAMISLGLGNTLELYDWMDFGMLPAFLGPHFFPAEDTVSSTLSALAVFAVGFAVRPLGGVLFGVAADLIGRRRVMLGSVALMAVTTLVIAVTPTYGQIAVWAGIFLVTCRLLQGVSTGIESPLSTAYAVELNPAGREGRAAGYISFFVNLGILLASLVSFATSGIIGGGAMQEWGWRGPVGGRKSGV